MNVSTPSLSAGPQRQVVRRLRQLIAHFPDRALFATRFTLEDQVLTHLIASHELPVRIFTRRDAGQVPFLLRSVDYFGRSIEVTFSQGELAAREHFERHPELVEGYEAYPASAPLAWVFRTGYLFITGLRAHEAPPAALLPGGPGKRTVFHPLFDWTERQLGEYFQKNDLPADLLPPTEALRLRIEAPLRSHNHDYRLSAWRKPNKNVSAS